MFIFFLDNNSILQNCYLKQSDKYIIRSYTGGVFIVYDQIRHVLMISS